MVDESLPELSLKDMEVGEETEKEVLGQGSSLCKDTCSVSLRDLEVREFVSVTGCWRMRLEWGKQVGALYNVLKT